MAEIPILMTVRDLRVVTFGHSPHQHGLKLLYWFSSVAVEFDESGDMELQCDADNGDYGFHHYGNYEDLLPTWNTYFEVGNLNELTYHGSGDLPAYVREVYSSQRNHYERNKDRIIISLDRASRRIGEVYITEHRFGLPDFNADKTFLLSPDIIREARDMLLIDFLTCAGFALLVHLGENLWRNFSSSDSSLDSDETDDEWQDDSSRSKEWQRPDSKTSTGQVVEPDRWGSSPGDECSGQPANSNCMNSSGQLPAQNMFSHPCPGNNQKVQMQQSFQDSKANSKLPNLLLGKEFFMDLNVHQSGSDPKPRKQPPFQQSDIENQPSCPRLFSDPKLQNNTFTKPDTKSANQMSNQEAGRERKLQNHLSLLPGLYPEPQDKLYQQNPVPGTGNPQGSAGPECKPEIMADEAVMHCPINEEDVVALALIVMVVLILVVFGFKSLGFIIIVSLCRITDCNLKWEVEWLYLVSSGQTQGQLKPRASDDSRG